MLPVFFHLSKSGQDCIDWYLHDCESFQLFEFETESESKSQRERWRMNKCGFGKSSTIVEVSNTQADQIMLTLFEDKKCLLYTLGMQPVIAPT